MDIALRYTLLTLMTLLTLFILLNYFMLLKGRLERYWKGLMQIEQKWKWMGEWMDGCYP